MMSRAACAQGYSATVPNAWDIVISTVRVNLISDPRRTAASVRSRWIRV